MVLLTATVACRMPPPPVAVQVLPPVQAPPADTSPAVALEAAGPVQVVMRRVHFRLDPVLALDIDRLYGELEATDGPAVVFDRPRSFVVRVAAAAVAVDSLGLDRLLNRYVFRGPDPPLRNLHVAAQDSLLRVEGTLGGSPGIPFTILASVSATAGGRVRLHPVDINVGPVDVDGFMHLFGIQLQEVIDAHGAVGLVLDGNDLLLDPTAALPPPRMQARLQAVRVFSGGLSLTFRDPGLLSRLGPVPSPPRADSNYMYFRGGLLHFGKLFMPRADMEVVDSAPGSRFDFYLDQYQRQLVAGHSETLPDYGLRVVMRDYADLVEAARRR